jgi:hypothetical protein
VTEDDQKLIARAADLGLQGAGQITASRRGQDGAELPIRLRRLAESVEAAKSVTRSDNKPQRAGAASRWVPPQAARSAQRRSRSPPEGRRAGWRCSTHKPEADARRAYRDRPNPARSTRMLGLITVEERRITGFRNDTNVVRVSSREWAGWLRMRMHRAGPRGVGARLCLARDLDLQGAVHKPLTG